MHFVSSPAYQILTCLPVLWLFNFRRWICSWDVAIYDRQLEFGLSVRVSYQNHIQFHRLKVIFMENWISFSDIRPQINDIFTSTRNYDDVIKWKHFLRYWPFVWGIQRPPVNSPHKGQWRGGLMLSWICAWMNGWVNNREAGDLRRHRAHYDVTVMWVGIKLTA